MKLLIKWDSLHLSVLGVSIFNYMYVTKWINLNPLTVCLSIQVHATDLDDGPSGKIRYSLGLTDDDEDGEALDVFTIDPETGVISNIMALDREMVAAYSLLVYATDGGEPGTQNSASAEININVMDFNDSPPRFARPTYPGSIAEDVDVGTVVMAITATDADLPVNGNLVYYITGGDPWGHFAIESLTGKLYVARPLDREMVSSYQMNITVTDGVFMDSTKATVDVTDVNDNEPVCVQVSGFMFKRNKISKKIHLRYTEYLYLSGNFNMEGL